MILTESESGGLFDTILGLPVHPLVVHGAVVLLPLAGLAAIALFVVKPWRARYSGLAWLLTLVATGASFVAKESGEALAHRVGEPAQHAQWGDRVPWVALALLVLGTVWLGLERSGRKAASSTTAPRAANPATLVLGALTALAGAAAIAVTVVTGHSGAEAVWASQISQSAATVTPTTTTTSTTTSSTSTSSPAATSSTDATTTSGTSVASETSSAASEYTMAAVQQHNSDASCWAVVRGDVYDLTTWIGQHPGGADKIRPLCGTDATAAFNAQHGTQNDPNERLATFKLAALAQ